MKNPNYTVSDLITVVFNMAHSGALLLVLTGIISGAVLLSSRPAIALISFLVAVVILIGQVKSRIKHAGKIRALRMRGGRLVVRHPKSDGWLPAEKIASFRKTFYAYADPWRPFTIGYPGIEIRLRGISSPAEDLFAYGMTEQRDRVFEYLKNLYPDKALEETKK